MRELVKNKYYFPLALWLLQLVLVMILGVATGLKVFANWDGQFYLHIAEFGYHFNMLYKGALIDGAVVSAAFFPLYPILIHVFQVVFQTGYLVSALFISNLAYFFDLIMVYSLLLKYLNERQAKHSLWLLAAFPGGLFFNMAYTESLNLLFIVCFFYCLAHDKWFLAILAGMLASATHDLGILLSVSALIFWWKHYRQVSLRKSLLYFLSIGFIALGLFFYMAYLADSMHDPIAFAHAQHYWGRHWMFPVVGQIHDAWYAHQSLTGAKLLMAYVNCLAALLFVGLGYYLIKDQEMPLEWKAFYLFTLGFILINGTGMGEYAKDGLQALARYMVVLFPGFYLMGKKLNGPVFWVIVVLLFGLKLFLTSLFLNGYYIT
jgi:hypothetical protein